MNKNWIYGDNVDTDVIIPARHLNSANLKDLCQKAIKKHTNHYQTLLSNLKV